MDARKIGRKRNELVWIGCLERKPKETLLKEAWRGKYKKRVRSRRNWQVGGEGREGDWV